MSDDASFARDAGHLNETLATFLATPLAQHDMEVIRQWQPLTGSLWRKIQPLMALQAKMRTASLQLQMHRMSYWEGGNPAGFPLLLLHGFGSSKENWAFVTARLGRHFRVIAPDLAGFGCSDFLHGEDYSLPVQADRIAQLMKALNIERAMVVGSSMGGAIAAQLAARYPEQVASLVLMNSAGAPGTRLTILESGLAAGVNYLAPARKADTLRTFQIALHRRHRLLGMCLAFVIAGEMSHRKPVNDFIFSHLVSSLLPTWECLDDIAAPTLVLWGDSDQVLDVSCTDAFQRRIHSAKVMVLPGVGHLPMLEEPGLSASVIRDFWIATASR